MKGGICRKNSRPFLAASLLGVSVGVYQRAMVNESGVIKSHMGTHNRSENGHSAWDVLHYTTP
jgi:hypothetical protein